jgi:hypothetical protein
VLSETLSVVLAESLKSEKSQKKASDQRKILEKGFGLRVSGFRPGARNRKIALDFRAVGPSRWIPAFAGMTEG